MTVAEAMKKMILFSDANQHNINHFLKVHAYAATIGSCEGLSPEQQKTLELAAGPLTRQFFENTDVPQEMLERIVYLVSHHHTLAPIDGLDYQILIEADYLVNADEHSFSKENIQNMHDKIFKTATGKELLRALYL